MHCLPSQLDAEGAEDILRLIQYLSAKGAYERRRQAMQEAEGRLGMMPGG